ncbi:glycosyltransferase family 4 protein [Blastopirellula marina]|uniref:Glycosyltransferase family 1 protein n=1 Tax=Blastopirellula marina TaxID=124 RepID=A0A2S8G0U8_9BACT|nr:glycosyltransferase family 4 protein [Blastopirellula marina]PQO38072.1 hypothetical protein C5Y98_08285 [Blastopirellula marina]PTL44728.1 glycosyltransferase family 1 protein [Blastopirellula marina]
MTSSLLDAEHAAELSSRRPLRVIHVIPHLGGGGTERVVWTLLPMLDPEICNPSLCVLGAENAFPSRTEKIQVDGFLGYNGSLRDVRGGVACIRNLKRLIRESKADIVHSHLWPAARIASLALRGTSIPHVVHMHDTRPWLEGRSWRDRGMRWLTNCTVPRSKTTYIAVSEAVKTYCCKNLNIQPKDVRVIHNGVDLNRFRPSLDQNKRFSRGTIVIGMVALFGSDKGHDVLLEAARCLASDGLDYELRLAGNGSQLPRMEALARELGIESRVKFVGLIDDVELFLQDLDIFVLPSLREGLPMTILEAMASGIPVAATNVGGVGEVIENDKNGLLLPPKNAGALANILSKLIVSRDLRDRFGASGLQTVKERFSFTGVAGKIEALYQEIGAGVGLPGRA